MRASMLLVMFFMPMIQHAQAISVFNANSVLDLVEQYSATIKSFKGSFVYKKNRATESGQITYIAPNKLLMQFGTASAPENKKIVIDGKFIIVQEGNLIARQKLESETSTLSAVWNIKPLRRQYLPIAPSTGLAIKYGNIDAYQVLLEPKVNTTSFRQIDLIVDQKGLIRRIKGISRVGDTTELTIQYNELNKEYDDKNFIVNTTEDSQIYDNIFE